MVALFVISFFVRNEKNSAVQFPSKDSSTMNVQNFAAAYTESDTEIFFVFYSKKKKTA